MDSVCFADNFFSSVELAQEMKSRGHHYVGTIRANRKHLPMKDLKFMGPNSGANAAPPAWF